MITVASQPVSLGRAHAGTVVTVHVSDSILTVDTPDGEQRTYRRATAQPVRSIKAYRPRKVPHVS